MKRTAKSLLTLITVLALTVSALISCDLFGGEDAEGSISVTLVIKDNPTVYKKTFDESTSFDKGLISLLDALEIEYTESYGMFSTVGTLTPEAPEYIYIYTSVSQDFDVSDFKKEMTYDGINLTSSGVGAADMHIKDGAVIYIGTIVYE